MTFSKEQIEKTLKIMGYVFFETGLFNVNIVGIRNSKTGKKQTNRFDDFMTISYNNGKNWIYKQWLCTTDNGAGTARVVEGQYRGSHIIRKHQGKYDAVCQDRAIKVYRDGVNDGIYDESKIQEGVFGINIHKAGADSTFVNNWSEGCQVFKNEKDFNEFMAICAKASSLHGNRFTYTLINSNDITIANPPIVDWLEKANKWDIKNCNKKDEIVSNMRLIKSIMLIFLLTGCSGEWYLKKAIKKNPAMAQISVYGIDTVFVRDSVTLTDTFLSKTIDTLTIEKDGVKTVVYRNHDVIRIKTVIKADTIRYTKTITLPSRVQYKERIKVPQMLGIVLLVILLLLLLILKK